MARVRNLVLALLLRLPSGADWLTVGIRGGTAIIGWGIVAAGLLPPIRAQLLEMFRGGIRRGEI